MVGQDLDARANDEHHEEKIEEVLPAHPCGESRCCRAIAHRFDRPWVVLDEPLNGRLPTQTLGDGDGDDEEHKADRQQPEEVEPFPMTDPDARSDSMDLRNRARKRRWVDDVLALG
jgi:hypothetical protein